ncbi:methanobactin export MATE transporter MbnM [Agaribacter marinus]|uniref:Di-heme enzyme n=1 Tax=Agaribacter marinus TaxID=1431249 RepID=A0AA37SYN6_9ALTE|nr:methanobactin export MATE transporter MbnM [Agaribacter marinus]GLR72567.1 di-heme enzyme [Agaribacter marinus]
MAAKLVSILTIVLLLLSCGERAQPYEWDLPQGFPAPDIPENNPMTKEKVALGRALFFARALSFNNTTACASCHLPERAFSEPKARSVGASGVTLKRNASALVNVAYAGTLTWSHNGLRHIEQQLMIPLFADTPIEMGVTNFEDVILARFNTADYKSLTRAAFGDSVLNFDRIVKSLASFVRSLVSFNSAFDDYAYRQIDEALSPSQLRGMELFFSEKMECFHCHGGFNFTQSSKHAFQTLTLKAFHNTGLYNEDGNGAYPIDDQGLIDVTLEGSDMGHFRAPTLRNVALTSPYMHDGSIASLAGVIEFYAAGGRGKGINNPWKSQFVKGFDMTKQERDDLINFLHGLTDESFIKNKNHHPPIPAPSTIIMSHN